MIKNNDIVYHSIANVQLKWFFVIMQSVRCPTKTW